MKKILLLTLLLTCSFVLSAKRSTYAVYEYRGEVLCKKSGTKIWIPVLKNMQLGILDSIAIPEGDYLRIRDEVGDGVYRSVSAGKMRVMDLVIRARKQSRQRVEMQVNDNLRHNIRNERPSMNVHGTSTRAMEEFTDSVTNKEELSPLSRIFWSVMTDNLEPAQTELSLRKIPFGQMVSFVIDNPTPLGYYVNVLHIDKKDRVMTYCYSFTENADSTLFYIYPGSSLTFHEEWFPNTPDDAYILIASPEKMPIEKLGDNCIYQKAE